MPPQRAREKHLFSNTKFHHTQFAAPCFCCVLPSFALLSSHSHTYNLEKKFFTLSRSHTFFAPEESERGRSASPVFALTTCVCVCVCLCVFSFSAQRREQRTCTPHEGMSRRSRKNILTFSLENSVHETRAPPEAKRRNYPRV
uniref:(northern house mosquito) hypothetical protein n=1 Tax=Culex pipiens TaxID=7175 RepID=A0A8D8GKA5_CULPI